MTAAPPGIHPRRPMNDSTGIDPAGLARLHQIGGAAFVKRMIDLFLEEAPDRLIAARKGEETGDLVAIAEAAHSLKSSAHNFGASRLSRIAAEIESRTRANKSENLSSLLGEFEAAYEAARVWLESQRDALKL
jgi:HPt (histidine-containing phosphotransfer) domain-containing protein